MRKSSGRRRNHRGHTKTGLEIDRKDTFADPPAELAQRHVIVRLSRFARNPFRNAGPWLYWVRLRSKLLLLPVLVIDFVLSRVRSPA